MVFPEYIPINSDIWISFFAGFVLSFIGSMPPGMISLTVAKRAIEKGMLNALWLGAGATLIEFFQTIFSLRLAQTYSEGEAFQAIFQWVAMLIFLVLGLYYLLTKPENPTTNEQKSQPQLKDFVLGLWMGSLNMLAIPYWMFYGTVLQVEGILESGWMHFISMAVGVSLGTFLLLWLYALGGKLLVQRMPLLIKWTHRTLGIVMLILAALQIWNLL